MARSGFSEPTSAEITSVSKNGSSPEADDPVAEVRLRVGDHREPIPCILQPPQGAGHLRRHVAPQVVAQVLGLEVGGRLAQGLLLEGSAGCPHHPAKVVVLRADVPGSVDESGVVHLPLGGELRLGQLRRGGLDPVVGEDLRATIPVRVEQDAARVEEDDLHVPRIEIALTHRHHPPPAASPRRSPHRAARPIRGARWGTLEKAWREAAAGRRASRPRWCSGRPSTYPCAISEWAVLGPTSPGCRAWAGRAGTR